MNKKRHNEDGEAEISTEVVEPGDRSIWKGYISFGLVNIPVILYAAEKADEKIHFKMLDKQNQAPIKYARVNVETGEEVPWQNIVKGYEYEPGKFVILSEEDFQSIALKNLKEIELEGFVNPEEISSIYYSKPYYLLPGKRGEKGYILLRETLKRTGKIGLVKITLRSHQYLAALIPQDNLIIINTLRYPTELKSLQEVEVTSKIGTSQEISSKELEVAEKLVESMEVEWEPRHYLDEYHDELINLIEMKLSAPKKAPPPAFKEPAIKQTKVHDFIALLQESLQQNQRAKKPYERQRQAASNKRISPKRYNKNDE